MSYNALIKDFVAVTDVVRDPYILFLKTYFRYHPEFPYSDDARRRKILIADAFSLSVEDIERMPSIIIMRGPISLSELSFPEAKTYENFFTKEFKIKKLATTSLLVHVVTQSGIVSERIASEIVYATDVFKDVLKSAGYQKITVNSIGSEQPLEIAGNVIERANVSVELSVTVEIKLKVTMAPELITELKNIYLETVETWDGTNKMIEMTLEKDGG